MHSNFRRCFSCITRGSSVIFFMQKLFDHDVSFTFVSMIASTVFLILNCYRLSVVL
jgi:hypothetical protein